MNKKETKQSLVEKNAVLIKENESFIANRTYLKKEISKLLGSNSDVVKNFYGRNDNYGSEIGEKELFSWARICFEIGVLASVRREASKDAKRIADLENQLNDTKIALQTLDKEGSYKHLYVQNF